MLRVTAHRSRTTLPGAPEAGEGEVGEDRASATPLAFPMHIDLVARTPPWSSLPRLRGLERCRETGKLRKHNAQLCLASAYDL